MKNPKAFDLVVHVPHASTHIPDDLWADFLAPSEEVQAEALASADLHTDQMAYEAWPLAKIVESKVSRVAIDVERYDDDNKEEMAVVGRGVFYTHDHKGIEIRKPLSTRRREELLDRYYRPYWQELKRQAAGAVLIDLHTYPVDPWPIERHGHGTRPEIDIGYTKGLTLSEWVGSLSQHFREHGYVVGHNTPYAGVIDAGVKAAVMIEIRRDIVGQPGGSSQWQKIITALATMPVEV
jgi:N-formylglutamate amidohydrolase